MLNLCKSNPATRLYPIHKSLYIIRYKTTELSQTPLASAAHHPLLPPATCRPGHHQTNILNKKACTPRQPQSGKRPESASIQLVHPRPRHGAITDSFARSDGVYDKVGRKGRRPSGVYRGGKQKYIHLISKHLKAPARHTPAKACTHVPDPALSSRDVQRRKKEKKKKVNISTISSSSCPHPEAAISPRLPPYASG